MILFTDNVRDGTTYIRWGKTSCSNYTDAELVYDGYATGGYYTHTGSGTNYLCLPKDPLHEPDIASGSRVRIYGAEYTKQPGFKNNLHNHDVPCAVCRTHRTNVLMIPGRKQCYNKWRLEYHGFLMTSLYTDASPKEFVCMDADPESLDSGFEDQNGALFYPVEARCGSLKCPPYIDNREVTCSVCSYIG